MATDSSGGSSESKVITDDSRSGAHRAAGPPTQPEPAQPSDAQLGAAAGSDGDGVGAAAADSSTGNGSGASGGDDGQQSDAGEWMDTTCDEEVCSLDFGDD
jgi:hypothetical protein